MPVPHVMITEIEDFFSKGCGRCARFATYQCSTRQWAAGLKSLREICLDIGLNEAVKWGHPCYMQDGRNIAIFGALRDDFRLSFFNAALMTDPSGVLQRQGPNTVHPDMIRFTQNDQVAAMAPVIRSYLREAMDYASRGLKPTRSKATLDLPDELIDALDSDPELADAFHRLTPGRQRSYVINLNAARQSATRTRRIAGFRDRILSGKGATER